MPECGVTQGDLKLALANLHDTFLNASLVRHLMLTHPVDANPETFHFSDRARLERLWVALLAVLVEAWRAKQMKVVREFLEPCPGNKELQAALHEFRKSNHETQVLSTRHYMFHRDRREYWNDGRLAPIGGLDFYIRLHDAFGNVLLQGIERIRRE